MRIAVVDGQGGGIGKHITEKLRKELPEGTELLALGTNALATAVMLRAGASEGASGENAIIFNAPKVDLIVGPIGIIVPNSMLGELTPKMSAAIVDSPAPKILLPLIPGKINIVGLKSEPLPHLIDELVQKVRQISGDSGLVVS